MAYEKLLERREIWGRKRILRELYGRWAGLIKENLVPGGTTLELGSGSGILQEFISALVSTDMIQAEWLDMVCNALYLPFRNSSVDNIVMIDVFHHMANPVKFLREARRVLKKGGRIVVLEPYGSPFSIQVYRRFHEEPLDYDVDCFAQIEDEGKDPWVGNQAIAQLFFFMGVKRFEEEFGGALKIVKKRRLSYLLYPLSGGFGNASMVPNFLIRPLELFERLLDPLAPLLAFRCLVVLEKV